MGFVALIFFFAVAFFGKVFVGFWVSCGWVLIRVYALKVGCMPSNAGMVVPGRGVRSNQDRQEGFTLSWPSFFSWFFTVWPYV